MNTHFRSSPIVWATAVLVAVSTVAVLLFQFGERQALIRWAKIETEMSRAVGFLRKGGWNPITGTMSDDLPKTIVLGKKGEELSSWRFVQLNWDAVARDVEPKWHLSWTDPANEWLRETTAPIYCYSREAKQHGDTNCMAVTGKGTAFDEAHPVLFYDIEQEYDTSDRSRSIEDPLDGTG